MNASRAREFWLDMAAPPAMATHIWVLTGTPMVNSAADFWIMLYGALGLPWALDNFCRHFTHCIPDRYAVAGYKPTGIQNTHELAEILRPHVLRRTLSSVGIDLPPLTTRSHPITLDPRDLDAILYALRGCSPEQIRQMIAIDSPPSDPALPSVRRALGLAKAPYVAHYLSQRTGPIVVFFQHTDVRNFLLTALDPASIGVIDGKTSPIQLREARQAFAARQLDYLLVQLDAGGVGLNLTESAHVVVAELPWTAVTLYQAIKRCHRISQTRPVQADIMTANGVWLDALMGRVITEKSRASQELLDLLTSSH